MRLPLYRARIPSSIPRTLKLIRAAAPRWTVAWFTLLLAQGLLPVASVFLTRALVNSVVEAMSAHWSRESAEKTILLAALMGCTLLMAEVFKSLAEWVRSGLTEVLQDYIKNLIHTQCAAVDLALYESSDYYDRLHRAANEGSGGVQAMLDNMGGVAQSMLTLLGMAAILIPYGGWLPVMLVASTSPALYVAFRYNRRYHAWWLRTTSERRWAWYYDSMLTNSSPAAEVRLFQLGDHFQSAYQSIRRNLRSERLNLIRDKNLAGLSATTCSLVVSAVVVLVFLLRVLQGAATLGDLALFYQAFTTGQSLIRSLFGNLSQIYSNKLLLDSLFSFFDLKAEIADPKNPEPVPTCLSKGIRFHQVTFRYVPGASPALSNLDMHIPVGRVAAIVGPNGSGKSTLLKLLCRFYDPDSGQIELDGIDIRKMPVRQLRRLQTVLFQSPFSYLATASENIRMADLGASVSRDQIEHAAKSAGVHQVITRLPKGYDTLLGKLFIGGTELSGGEWQRIALARAYLRQAQIVILDEPTSFMDPWSEAEWFARLRQLVKDRTTIVITHRLTIAMRADIVYVMNKGQIVESGTHPELVAQGGFYARSWASQMQASPPGIDETSIPMHYQAPWFSADSTGHASSS